MTIKLTLMGAGYCTHPEYIVMRRGQRKSVPFPAIFALLEHPKLGLMLFDTGYTSRFYRETRRFPYNLYAKVTPVHLDEADTALCQLKTRGITAEDIQYLMISHFHADHIGGLADFPNAKYIYFREAYEAVRERRGLSAVRAGFLRGLIPQDFEQRSEPVDSTKMSPLPSEYAPFDWGVDVFGDRSVMATALPGHANGQMGLFLRTDDEPVFLVADACWQSRAYRELILSHLMANLVFADSRAYRDTLKKLHELHQNNPRIRIIPSHCREVFERYVQVGVPHHNEKTAHHSGQANAHQGTT